MAKSGAEKELAKIHEAAADVAAEEIGVHTFEIGGRKKAAGQDAVAEAGGETLDLILDGGEHVDFGSIRDVTVGPGDVFAGGCARGSEESWLREEDEWGAGTMAAARGFFGCGYFFEAAGQVHGCGAQAGGRSPRNGIAERIVDLEDAGAGAETQELTAIAWREMVAGNLQKLARGDIAENQVIGGEGREGFDARRGVDLPAKRREIFAEGIGDGLRSALWNGPADGMSGDCEDHTECAGERLIERKKRVGGETGEECASAIGLEAASDGLSGEKSVQPETRHQQGMTGDGGKRAKDFRGEVAPMLDERLHKFEPGSAVRTERLSGCIEIAIEQDCGAVIERLRERGGRLNPREAMVVQRQRREERRAHGEGMHGRSEVVDEAGERQFHGARGATGSCFGFEYVDFEAGLSQDDGRRESVGTGADYAGFGDGRHSNL